MNSYAAYYNQQIMDWIREMELKERARIQQSVAALSYGYGYPYSWPYPYQPLRPSLSYPPPLALPGPLPGTSSGAFRGALPGALPGAFPGALPGASSGAFPGALPGALSGVPHGAAAIPPVPPMGLAQHQPLLGAYGPAPADPYWASLLALHHPSLLSPLSSPLGAPRVHRPVPVYAPPAAAAIPPRQEEPKLWRFLLDLLLSGRHRNIIQWTGRGVGEFQLLAPDVVARRWGLHKRNRYVMTYDKLSRALRYYYGKGILEKVPGQKFAYRFLSFPDAVVAPATANNSSATSASSRTSSDNSLSINGASLGNTTASTSTANSSTASSSTASNSTANSSTASSSTASSSTASSSTASSSTASSSTASSSTASSSTASNSADSTTASNSTANGTTASSSTASS